MHNHPEKIPDDRLIHYHLTSTEEDYRIPPPGERGGSNDAEHV